MNNIGLKIKLLRNSLGLTQDAFAQKAGTTRGNIAQIELQNQAPTLKILSEIKKNFGISIDELLDDAIEVSYTNNKNASEPAPPYGQQPAHEIADLRRTLEFQREQLTSLERTVIKELTSVEGEIKGIKIEIIGIKKVIAKG